jgi:glycosyltransferase involved in cell wall biosynthesis
MATIRTLGIWIETVGPEFNRTEGISRVATFLMEEFLRQGVSLMVACPTETVSHIHGTAADLGVLFGDGIRFVSVRARDPLPLRASRFLDRRITMARQDLELKRRQVFVQRLPLRKAHGLLRTLRRRDWQKAADDVVVGGRVLARLVLKLVAGMIGGPLYLAARPVIVRAWKGRDWRKHLAMAASQVNVDCWWVANPTWIGARHLSARNVVTSVWDLVHLESGEGFPPPDAQARVLEVLAGTSATVSMSEYVRSAHVVRGSGFPAQRAFAVPIPLIEVGDPRGAPGSRTEALELVERYCCERFSSKASYDRYLCDFPFSRIDYILAASNIRPYKNYLRLVQAFERLIRRARRNLKLVVTGDLQSDPELWNYVVGSGLTVDVLSIRDVPSPILKVFFQGARIAVMPSLFEGGFPLTFSESVRMGTPIAMARIPTVTELVGPADPAAATLFDPLDVGDITRVLEWCLDHREEALAAQQPVYRQIRNRTWPLAARRYLEIFDLAARGAVP